MKLRSWYGIAFNLVLAALVITGAVLFTSHSRGKNQFLQIRDTHSGKLYGKWPLEAAGEFSIEFVHSVHQSPVREFFAIDNAMIKPVSVRFSAFGAGMQSDLEEGQVLSRDGDTMVISGFKSSSQELHYIVGTVSDHLLHINGQEVSLLKLCGKNAHITVQYNGGKNK